MNLNLGINHNINTILMNDEYIFCVKILHLNIIFIIKIDKNYETQGKTLI